MIKSIEGAMEKNSAAVQEGPRGTDQERRTAILDRAEEVFLEDGFQGASMSAIAANVPCSKGTLYNYFDSKEDLFLACMERQCEALRRQMSSLAATPGPLRETLTQMGRGYVAFVSSDDIVRRFRVIIAETERAPDMARAFYAQGPARGAEMLAGYLADAMRQGLLKEAEPLRAAQHFLGLCYDQLSKARLCNVAPAPDAKTIARDVEEAVSVFLAAYAVA